MISNHQLVLRISFKLILNIINKSLEVFKIFLKDDFKLRLYNKSEILVATFILDLKLIVSQRNKIANKI